MRLSSQSAGCQATQQPRLIAGGIFYSGLAAEALLLVTLYGSRGLLYGLASLLTLMLAAAVGIGTARWRHAGQLAGIMHGFLIAAAGLLLVVLALHAQRDWLALLPAVAISGVGQGMVGAALHQGSVRSRSGQVRLLVYGLLALLSCVLVLAIKQAVGGLEGRCFSFALLIDLALFGALLVRITQRDVESELVVGK
ncbi:hypothetical protein ACCC84_07715 [Serratia odorifera]|uniref:hypothetical protein n=1 Tax=Serratia odorifera TaxID=618 RepID=UPI0035319909